MIYKVTKQFGGGKEQPTQQFKALKDAKTFAAEGAESDAAMKIQSVYRVYEFDDLIETIDSSKVQSSTKPDESSGSSRGQASGARFSPTPLEMSPRPKGTAPKVWSDDNKDDKSDE